VNFYPKKISEKFRALKNTGKAENANASGTSATFICGAVLRFYLRIETETKRVAEAKFQTNGCGFLIAAADVLSDEITGKNLREFHGAGNGVLETRIESELGKFSAHRKHCLEICLEALQNAFTDFRHLQIEEYAGEKALICTCFGVSEETIENIIDANSLETVKEVTDICSAGGGCGSCQFLIQEILDVRQMENR
jgi:NifU-like protein